jgi:L-threonylcarbamoyladenylate synthase
MATPFQLRRATHAIRNGGVIAYPTETLYGLGCDPQCAKAVERIYAIKQRQAGKGIILVAAGLQQLDEYIDVGDEPDRCKLLPDKEPTSWVVPASPQAPSWLVSNGTVAVRISTHPAVIELCNRLGHAITSTSANISGHPPAASPLQLHRDFDGKVDAFVIPDETQRARMSGRPSRVRALHTDIVYRAG